MNLSHLTLDMRDTLGPEGEHMGVRMAQSLADSAPFPYGTPVNFEILAPVEHLEEMYGVFAWANI